MSKQLNITSFIICLIFTASLFSISTTTVSAEPCHKRIGVSVNPADDTKYGTGTSCRKKEAIHLAKKDFYTKNCGNAPNCTDKAKCTVWKKISENVKKKKDLQVSCDGSAKHDGGKVKIKKSKNDEVCKEITGKATRYTATVKGRWKCECSCPYVSPDAPAC